MTVSQEREIKNNPPATLEIIERLKRDNEHLLSQVKIAQEVSEELGIIGMVGSIAWKAQMLRLTI